MSNEGNRSVDIACSIIIGSMWISGAINNNIYIMIGATILTLLFVIGLFSPR